MSSAQIIYNSYSDLLQTTGSNLSDVGLSIAIPIFEKSTIENLLSEVDQAHNPKRTYIEVSGPFIVVGDLNGNLQVLLEIFKMYGIPPRRKYIFLGNMVDFGEFSLEVATLLMAIKVLYPSFIYLLKGTNEVSPIFLFRGLKADLISTYGHSDLYDQFIATFSNFPRAAIIDDNILCCQTTFIRGFKDFRDSVNHYMHEEKINFKTYLEMISQTKNTDDLNINEYAKSSGFSAVLLGNFEDSLSIKEYDLAVAVRSCDYDSYAYIINVNESQECIIEEFKTCTCVTRDKSLFFKQKIEINRSRTMLSRKIIKPCPANLNLPRSFQCQSHVIGTQSRSKW